MNFINKKRIATLLSLFILFVFLLPSISFALSSSDYVPLITCGNKPITDANGKISGGCNFDDFIKTINRIINWIISLAGVIFTISFIYGGFLYMTSGESPGNKAKAKSILLSTLTGFVIILVSWLIVFTILKTLTPYDSNNTIFRFIGGTS